MLGIVVLLSNLSTRVKLCVIVLVYFDLFQGCSQGVVRGRGKNRLMKWIEQYYRSVFWIESSQRRLSGLSYHGSTNFIWKVMPPVLPLVMTLTYSTNNFLLSFIMKNLIKKTNQLYWQINIYSTWFTRIYGYIVNLKILEVGQIRLNVFQK